MSAAVAPHALPMFVTCSELDAKKSIVWHFLEVSAGAVGEGSGGGRYGRGGNKNKPPKLAFPFSL